MQNAFTRRLSSAAILPLALVLAGCTGASSGYPSLSPRPIEDLSLAEPTRPAAPPAIPNAGAASRYAPIIEQAKVDDAAFHRTLTEERTALANGRGAPEGSDAWTAAQEALSRVETVRGPVTRALSELDAARNSDASHSDTGEAIAASQAFEQLSQIDESEATALREAWPASR